MPGNIAEISSSPLITADKYNEIQNQVYQVVGPDFYSYDNFLSHAVTKETEITGQIFKNLYIDINKALIHQTNNPMASNMDLRVGDNITQSWINQLINYSNQIYINRYNYSTSQMIVSTTSSTRFTRWNSNIKHVVQYVWDSESDANGFFNLGGKIYASLTSSNAVEQIDNTRWRNLINSANTQLEQSLTHYVRTNWVQSNINDRVAYSLAAEGADGISIAYLKTSNKSLTVTLQLITDPSYYEDGVDYVTIDVTSNIHSYQSKGDDTNETGYPSPTYSAIVLFDLEQGGYSDFVGNRKITSDPANVIINGYTTSTTNSQLLKITNSGNTVTNITSITSDIQGGTLITDFSGSTQELAVGSSLEYNISFNDADYPGTYNGYIIVGGNFRKGPYKIPLTLNLENIPFGFTLTPDNTTIQVDTLQVETSQKVRIVLNSKYLTYDSYSVIFVDSANKKMDTPPGFSIDTSDLLGPKVIYNPKKLPKATYTCRIAVTIKEKTQYASIAVVNNISQNDNIASFVSAYGMKNSIVGLSYDLIQGKRFLTIGIGVGANGSPELSSMADSKGAISSTDEKKYIDATNLGYMRDPTFSINEYSKYQQVVYQTTVSKTATEYDTMSKNYGDFLLSKGVWVDDRRIEPLGRYFSKTYRFNLEYDSLCKWEFSVDDTGYFYIDSTKVIEPTSKLNSSLTGNISLTAGVHTITYYALNKDFSSDTNKNPGSIAIELTNANNGNLIWNTRTWERLPVNGYRYWQEVYRIPLPENNKENTFYNKEYCIKDPGGAAGGNTWSSFFKDGSLFKIAIDNLGNLTINTQEIANGSGYLNYKTTAINLLYSLYYYISPSVASRYKNLDTPSAGTSTTTLFTGFTWNGSLITNQVTYPGYQPNVESTFDITPKSTSTVWKKNKPFYDDLQVVGFSAGYDTSSETDYRSNIGTIFPEGNKSYSSLTKGGSMKDGTVLLDFIDLWGSSDRGGNDRFGFRITIGGFANDPTKNHLVKVKVQCLYTDPLKGEIELYSKTIDNNDNWNYKFDSTTLGKRGMWWIADNWYNSIYYTYTSNNKYLNTSLFIPPTYNSTSYNTYFYNYIGETRAGNSYYTGYHNLLMNYRFRITLITKPIAK